MMNHKERFLATIANAPVDRPASWIGLPDPAAIPGLIRHLGLNTMEEVKILLDDDIYPIEVPYYSSHSNHIAGAFDFAKRDQLKLPGERTLTTPGFFEVYDDPADVSKFNWPDPAKYLDGEEIHRRVNAAGSDYARMGILWSSHFHDSCSAFGMETALTTMLTNHEMYRAVLTKITNFYLKANEIFYEATKGKLDAVLLGDDFGSQTGLMLDPELIRQYIFPGTKLLIDQAKSYGLKVMYHSCGSIFPLIEDIFRLGADIIHPLQARATDMSVENIHKHFSGKGAFCGGIDAQYLMVEGSPEDVKKRVHEVIDLFPTGLIVSPSYEAFLPDIPPENIEALFKTVANRKL
ncbi:uroporphyrinogen decarboxylase family protein [Maribellus sediminis]|uniref:uroporphyrinogen decarboxylase family protein n=1 Tax=Maribellus sediminis TaxID=2696285 RepID=UPI00197D0C9E|nr:uroporphyrinogen decarboxylase family protein [Maribellus sediminis]